ncbi:MAG TPA: CoB--CoM heterodisulfide reductase iron-sulfur subunit B family protein [Candidatus Bathyarchaeia archaeon]|nr:CoB--CoM heterodisulfide reductase iron-sulfur subunit B family protein [Candidatus Bathyarchaeia archaeon]
MKYAYFPGCSVEASAQEYEKSTMAVNKVLGIELIEIPDWNCCGSIDAVHAYNPKLSLSLSARNFSIAEGMNLDIVTLCSACFFTLSRAGKMLREDSDLKCAVNKIINDAGLKSTGEVKVRHYLDVLANDVGFEKIAQNVKIPLKGLKVAPYYGCLLVRPPQIVSFDDPEHPKSMDRIVEALGGESMHYNDKTRCCGASLVLTDESVMLEMTKDILLSAKNLGADCIVTPCPMCHFNLDAKQKEIESHYGLKINMPILYFTQLMGIAFGLGSKELGLNRNIVSPSRILEKLGAQVQTAPKT